MRSWFFQIPALLGQCWTCILKNDGARTSRAPAYHISDVLSCSQAVRNGKEEKISYACVGCTLAITEENNESLGTFVQLLNKKVPTSKIANSLQITRCKYLRMFYPRTPIRHISPTPCEDTFVNIQNDLVCFVPYAMNCLKMGSGGWLKLIYAWQREQMTYRLPTIFPELSNESFEDFRAA